MSSTTTPDNTSPATAVLLSGGIDSAILVAELLDAGRVVQPLYVRCGLRWERAELDHVRRLLAALAGPRLRAPAILEVPVADLYHDHWSLAGNEVPGSESPDEAVYLPGRNVLLLTKAMLWCHLNRVPVVALAVLKGNPFPDATPQFICDLTRTVNEAIGGAVRIEIPYAMLTKREVLLRGRHLPLELTFCCLGPIDGLHCGKCNKCAERQKAFADAGMMDPTVYARTQMTNDQNSNLQ
ncbi:MAG: 7-cyano-7-deazaguanine synthase [Planctomycetia bacterium]|nr:7-cyano-7-deazaguanine synthase [Planctomycetia bacterium]